MTIFVYIWLIYGDIDRVKRMDRLDKAILEIVQRNNQHTHGYIGECVGLSASSVKRRLARMRKDGVIVADVAITDPSTFGITVIVQIVFERGSKKSNREFRALIEADSAISQCYSIEGQYDYLLIIHTTSPEAFEQWAEHTLMDNDAIQSYNAMAVWSRTKFSPVIEPISPWVE